jgi:hypothetical protein
MIKIPIIIPKALCEAEGNEDFLNAPGQRVNIPLKIVLGLLPFEGLVMEAVGGLFTSGGVSVVVPSPLPPVLPTIDSNPRIIIPARERT